jgi:hypothetical protein
MRVTVTGGVGDLANDMVSIVRRVPGDLTKTVREGAKVGNVVARDLARVSAGAHGKHYPKAFSSEVTVRGLFGMYAAEYGPDITKPQGGMSFERGSRNQPPHNDLAKSADLMGPALAKETHDLTGKWFW